MSGYAEDEGSVTDEEDVGDEVDEEEEEEEEEVDYELDEDEDARFADHPLEAARARRRDFTDRSRITLDPEGNEIDMSDEDMEAIVDDELEEVENEEEVEEGDVDEDEMMQDRGSFPPSPPLSFCLTGSISRPRRDQARWSVRFN